MTFPSTAGKQTYTGDGSTTAFAIPFPYHDKTYIKASLDKVSTTAFSVTNGSAQDGHIQNGTLTFNTAPASGVAIAITCSTPIAQQAIDKDASNSMDVEDVEHLLDYWAAVIRDLDVKVDNAQDLAADDLRTEFQDLVDDAEAARDAAQTAETNAETAESNAQTHESTAQGHAGTALNHSNTASGHADNAEIYKDQAQTAAGQASAIANGTLHTYVSLSPGASSLVAGGAYEIGDNGDGDYDLSLPTPSAAILIKLLVTSDNANVKLIRDDDESINNILNDVVFSGAGYYSVAVYDSTNWAVVKGELDGIYAQTQAGPAGANGADGSDGADGATLRHGAGAPASGLGNDGDYYMNTTNGDFYSKSGGSWTSVVNLTGPTGSTGATGPAGPTGPQGPAGADGADGTGLTTGNKGDITVVADDDWDINDNAVTSAKINASAVTAAKIGSNAVETAKINAAAVTAAKLASSAVETAKINDGAVTAAKLATDAVTTVKIDDGAVTNAKINDVDASKVDNLPADFVVAVSDEDTDLTTGTAKVTFRMPYAMTLDEVRASVNTAPTGSTIIVDINESGSTVLSTKLSIDASEKTSETAASSAVISDSALADDAEITIDIDQVGSTVAGTGLKVAFIGKRA